MNAHALSVLELPRALALVADRASSALGALHIRGLEPMAGLVTFESVEGGTRMTAVTRFTDLGQMETMLAMGMQEGMTQAIGQIDALLAAPSA